MDTTELEGRLADVIAALTARDTAQAVAKSGTETLHSEEHLFDIEMTAVKVLAETLADGDAAILEAGGFDTYVPGAQSEIGELGIVENLVASPGPDAGIINLNWDSLKGAKSFLVYITTTPEDLNSWVFAGVSTDSELSLSGLDQGTLYWIKVSGVGTAGEGPRSDVASSVAA